MDIKERERINDSKARYIARRNSENAEIAKEQGLGESQIEALEELCEMRHFLHCNSEALFYTEFHEHCTVTDAIIDCDSNSEFETIKKLFGVAPFTLLNPWDVAMDCDWNEWKYEDSDGTVYEENIDEDENTERYWKKFNLMKTATINQVNKICAEIETFLYKIDSKHGTSYCPTGFARLRG